MVSFPYYSHTTPIRIPKDMGMVWEAYRKGVPLLGVPENPIEITASWVDHLMITGDHLLAPTASLMGEAATFRSKI